MRCLTIFSSVSECSSLSASRKLQMVGLVQEAGDDTLEAVSHSCDLSSITNEIFRNSKRPEHRHINFKKECIGICELSSFRSLQYLYTI